MTGNGRIADPPNSGDGREPGPITVGEPFALDDSDVGDCPSLHWNSLGVPAPCVLDRGHAVPHISSDGHVVVEVWP